jgi:hypothetical protein
MCNRSRPDVRIRRSSAVSGSLGGRPGASPGMSSRREAVDDDDGTVSSREIEGLGAQIRWSSLAEPSIRRSASRPETGGAGRRRPFRSSGSRNELPQSDAPVSSGSGDRIRKPAVRPVEGARLGSGPSKPALDRGRRATIRPCISSTLRAPASAGVISREQGTPSRRTWQRFPATRPKNSTSSCN